MTKTFTTTLMVSAFVLAFSSLAMARTPGTGGGHGGHGGGSPASGPSAPSAPSGPAASASAPGSTGTEADTAWFDSAGRRTMNVGFCERNANDYFVRAGLAVCTGY